MSISALLLAADGRRNESLSGLSGIIGLAATETLLRAVSRLDRTQHYKYFPPAFQRAIAEVAQKYDEAVARQALSFSMWNALVETLRSDSLQLLPIRIQRHQLVQFRRILDAQYESDDWLSLESDLFHKDFGIASLRLYAAAAQLVDPACGVPRSVVFRAGILRIPAAVAAIASVKGFSPMFQIHTHLRYLDEFNVEGWNECYRACADLYSVHPTSLGMYGGSWFYDPVVSSISPRLSYLSVVPKSGGAHFLLGARQGHFVDDAISTSPSRRKLFEEGKYNPRSFYMIWGRHDQSAWAAKNQIPIKAPSDRKSVV